MKTAGRSVCDPAGMVEAAETSAFYLASQMVSTALRARSNPKERTMRDTESNRLTLPKGGTARLFATPDLRGCAWAVVVAAKAENARLESLTRRGAMSALLTHDEGLSWPNTRGEALAAATLEHGGAVALAFATLADALGCKARLAGGAR
jgi:hypothetical protein